MKTLKSFQTPAIVQVGDGFATLLIAGQPILRAWEATNSGADVSGFLFAYAIGDLSAADVRANGVTLYCVGI